MIDDTVIPQEARERIARNAVAIQNNSRNLAAFRSVCDQFIEGHDKYLVESEGGFDGDLSNGFAAAMICAIPMLFYSPKELLDALKAQSQWLQAEKDGEAA